MRHLLKSALAACLLTVPALGIGSDTVLAQQQNGSVLSTLDRETLRQEIRQYLLDEPQIIMEAVRILEQRQQMAEADRERQLIAQYNDALYKDENSYVGGNPEGSITLIEFLDYRCGYCKRAHGEVAELIRTDGDIRLIVKEFPILGPDSVLAARAAIATKLSQGDEAYKNMNNALMEFGGTITDKVLARIAKSAGIDGRKMQASMSDPRVDEIIAANRQLAAALDISGTPTFILPSKFIKGYLPYERMVEAVQLARRVQN